MDSKLKLPTKISKLVKPTPLQQIVKCASESNITVTNRINSRLNTNRNLARQVTTIDRPITQQFKRPQPKPTGQPKRGVENKVSVKRPATDKPLIENPTKKVTKVEKWDKPPPYDYKARFNILLQAHNELRKKYDENSETYDNIKQENQINKDRRVELEDLTEQYEKDNQCLKQRLSDMKMDYEQQLTNIKKDHEKRLSELSMKYDDILVKYTDVSEKYALSITKVTELDNAVRYYEEMRRQLHNKVQDLKGTIRVYCRIRPELESEAARSICPINYLDERTLEIKKGKESISQISGKLVETKQEFTFDHVFPPESTQAEIFEELSQLVQSALDGYDICVFAYGQTGSGKTFTMLGTSAKQGMIPLSVNLIFNQIDAMKENGWRHEIRASFLEIYNETVNDLLDPYNKENKAIKYNEGKGASVTNIRIETVKSAIRMHELMAIANNNRAQAATDFNEHSSRSHAVTKIEIIGTFNNVIYKGSLNLVDLAGSESAKTSSNDRLNETKNINKSLSTLGSVMLALYNREKFVPYRSSKLTFLLQSCLGGNSKTLMFVNISPFEHCYAESINSLRFASKVKEVRCGSRKNKITRV